MIGIYLKSVQIHWSSHQNTLHRISSP